MTTFNAYLSPNGDQIIGTIERIIGIARISGIDPESHEPEYEGRTDILWDTSEPIRMNGKIVFICGSGEEWTFDQLTVVSADNVPEP